MRKISEYRFRWLRHSLLLLLGLMACGCGSQAQPPDTAAPSTPAPVKTALDEYIARDEAVYKWTKTGERQIGKNLVTTLDVASQTWQGIVWKHKVEIVTPEKNDFPGTALLYLSTSDSAFESILTQSLAGQLGATVVHVMGMPNQPLWKMREDDLIAHSFTKFVETGDETWPLLLPMTKGAVKAMDAAQEYSAQQNRPLNKFIVAGASKRGWTTWLVGAVDTQNRIAGLIPIVYDNLDLSKQLPHQFASWGEYSPMIQDYTRRGLQQLLTSPAGAELTRIVDPYTYRERFTMPKLIVNGTNDPYWTTDALNLYWNDLPEPKNVYYAPNVGHSLEGDHQNVFGTIVAWFRRVAGNPGKAFVPNVELQIIGLDANGAGVLQVAKNSGISQTVAPHKYEITLNAGNGDALQDVGGVRASRLWVTHSATRDFRKSQWQAVPIKNVVDFQPAGISMPLPQTPTGQKYSAAFLEVEYGNKLRLSSPLVIWSAEKIQ